MRDMNRVIFTGRLTADPELRTLTTGASHVGVSVAINSQRKSGDKYVDHVDFVEVAVYGKTAENVAKHLKKGSKVLIEGRMAQQRWEDKATGGKRSKLGVVAEIVNFMDRPASGDPRGFDHGSPGTDVPHNVGQSALSTVEGVFPDAASVSEDEIPF